MIENSKVVTIDGHKFTFYALPAVQGRRLVCKLMNAAAPAFSKAASAAEAEHAGLALLGGALEALSPELVEETLTAFGDTEVEIRDDSGKVRSPRISSEKEFFRQRYLLLAKFLAAGIEYNFGDFLGGKSLLGALEKVGSSK